MSRTSPRRPPLRERRRPQQARGGDQGGRGSPDRASRAPPAATAPRQRRSPRTPAWANSDPTLLSGHGPHGDPRAEPGPVDTGSPRKVTPLSVLPLNYPPDPILTQAVSRDGQTCSSWPLPLRPTISATRKASSAHHEEPPPPPHERWKDLA